MSYQSASGRLVAWVTFMVALVLQIMPLPAELEAWRPDWVLITLICWTMRLPLRYSIFTGFILGVVLDVLLGATIGIRALGFSICIYLVLMYQQRLMNFPRWQQSLVVFAIVALYQLLVYWLEFILGVRTFSVDLFYPAISSFVIWRWAYWVIRSIAHKYRVT
ncbi:rod shape-determining protein MreD [Parashewanella curva]|uniref:Rod shape-determining protein MreD n=1 Tax=Parashewanella curva TaxID=2338552 RepID=A0A3L8PUM8_9GAMM|nr:rod shape-determining protein MreD [Parashewanella curva]RLV59030.1 rod shape-determining protein MreD [Parashewanella curva]